jgi:hypothetical protein
MSQRVASRPELRRDSLADDRDVWRASLLCRRKAAAADDREPDDVEKLFVAARARSNNVRLAPAIAATIAPMARIPTTTT